MSHRGQVGWRRFVACRFFRGGLLGYALKDNVIRFATKPSVGRDALVPPHNVFARFYDVISTGVRTTVLAKAENA